MKVANLTSRHGHLCPIDPYSKLTLSLKAHVADAVSSVLHYSWRLKLLSMFFVVINILKAQPLFVYLMVSHQL